jgi:type II secretory pathway pseudopilin PulG
MVEFSYDSAIAPMKSNFFSDVAATKGITSNAARYLTSKYTAEVSPYLESQIKTQDDMLKSQYQQLAFKRQQLDLMTAADEAKAQREALETLPTDIQNLTGIVNDPNKSSFEKLTAVGQYKMENAGRLTRNKSLVNLVGAAEDTLKIKDETDKQKTALGYALASQGLPEAVKSVFGGDVAEGVGKQYYDAAAAIGEQKTSSARTTLQTKAAMEAQKEQEKRRTQQYGAQLDFFKTRLSELNRIGAAKQEEGFSIGSLKDPTATGPVPKNGIPQAAPFKFKPEDKAQIEETIRALHPELGKTDLSKYSDEDLYRNAYQLANRGVTSLLGIQPPSASTISSKF